MPLLAPHSTHPYTYGYQTARPERQANGWLPDAVTDTTAKRRRGAQRLIDFGSGVFPRLWTLSGRQLWHVVIPLPQMPDFYGCVRELGQAEMRRLFFQQPALVRAARGRSGHPHLHVAVALPAGDVPLALGTYGRIHATAIETTKQLWTLAEYFSRPADERAARPNRKDVLRYSRAALRQQRLDAAEDYLLARLRHGRLPRLRWQQGTLRAANVVSPVSRPLQGAAQRRTQPWCPPGCHVGEPRWRTARASLRSSQVVRNRGPPPGPQR